MPFGEQLCYVFGTLEDDLIQAVEVEACLDHMDVAYTMRSLFLSYVPMSYYELW